MDTSFTVPGKLRQVFLFCVLIWLEVSLITLQNVSASCSMLYKNNPPIAARGTEQEVRKFEREVREVVGNSKEIIIIYVLFNREQHKKLHEKLKAVEGKIIVGGVNLVSEIVPCLKMAVICDM